MKRRVVILTEIIAPYRIPVFNALAAHAEIDLHVIFLSETDPVLRQWQVYRDEIRYSYEVLPSYRRRLGRLNLLITRGMSAALTACNPQVIIAGGYNYVGTWQAQRWAMERTIPFLLWSESNIADARRKLWWVEAAKRKFIRSCQGYVVPGASAAEYLKTFGVADDRLFIAPNAVDVERFSRAADLARKDPALRARIGLPERYALFVGRLVRQKGIFDLLVAYAKLPMAVRDAVGLVFAGDGTERQELLGRSPDVEPGKVVFTGFLQRDDLPAIYALAEVLVLPTYSDTWGLVVNEAMACGVPVIASRVAGCVADLVKDGENGYVVEAGNTESLAEAMTKILTVPSRRDHMGECGRRMSGDFTPDDWAQGIVRAVASRNGDSLG